MSQQYNPGDKVQGKQRNHGDYSMPASIRHLGEMPLYRAVAWWGMLRGGFITRDDVSQAFRIEPRRAGGILNYICHRSHEGDIRFDVSHPSSKRAPSTLALRIVSIAPVMPQDRSEGVVTPNRTSGNQDRVMARWLLSRPAEHNVEQFARWKASCPTTISE